MVEITVFDWAQVQLAEEYLQYLAILFTDISQKQDIVQQLANAGGVSLSWDLSGHAKLEGPWPRILKAQSVFEHYLSSLEDPPTTDSDGTIVSNLLGPFTANKEKGGAEIDLSEGNEVYVNITLSGSFDNLTGKLEKDSDLNFNSNGKALISSDLNTQGRRTFFSEDPAGLAARNEFSNNQLLDGQHSGESVPSNAGVNHSYSVPFYNEECPEVSHHTFVTDDLKGLKPISSTDSKNGSPAKHGDCTSSRYANEQDENTSPLSEPKNSLDEASAKYQSHVLHPIGDISVADYEGREPMKQMRKYVKKKDYEELTPFKFFCSLCSFKSKRESHFQKHIKLHNEVSEIFKCSQCNFSTIRLSHLRRHELSHSSLKMMCSECHYHTNSQKLLARHKRMKHDSSKMFDAMKEILSCRHCVYQTNSYHLLERHQKVHLKEISTAIEIFHCDQCSYKTNRREHLVRHTNNIHKGQRPFLCHHCGKAFKRQDALKMHSTTHVSQGTVICPDCGKGCRSQAHLAQHRSVHSNDRAFLCELCGASFKTRAVQRKHIRTIHQHPKAYVCSHCSRKFSTKFALRRHINQHSMEKRTKPPEEQEMSKESAAVFVPDISNSLKLLPMDTVLIHNLVKPQVPQQPTTLQNASLPSETDKITVQIPEHSSQGALHNIPPPAILQPSSEVPALVYLSAPFHPY